MTEKIYLDADIILDLLAERVPFHAPAVRLFSLIETGEIKGHVSPLIFANLYYLLRKLKSGHEARIILTQLKLLLTVLPINERIIELALHSNFNDFEDAIQYYTAIENNISILITRNKSDYKHTEITVCDADEYLKIRNSIK
ncbi:MAG: PIN domain-containing protein [Firmicutes bacterium]|nr:PIN domain-containing protein [Bacillota bacterium]